ncbi:MAG: hypothetical protein V2J16_09975 [Thermoleophilia bacterium]|nr:hypothetical protein [Thermoleophilia bacterium]
MRSTRDKRRRPGAANLLAAFCAVQGMSGVAGGLGLMLDPSGESLSFSQSYLEGTPFGSFLVPGLVLFVVLGLLPLVVFYGLVRDRAWSWLLSVVLGVGLVIWLATEVVLVGDRLYSDAPVISLFLWGFYGVVAAAILILSQLPSVRGHDRASPRATPRTGETGGSIRTGETGRSSASRLSDRSPATD